MQMSTTHSSFDQYRPALVIKLLVIEQLLHPAPKSTVSSPWHNFDLYPSSQQLLATSLVRAQVRHEATGGGWGGHNATDK